MLQTITLTQTSSFSVGDTVTLAVRTPTGTASSFTATAVSSAPNASQFTTGGGASAIASVLQNLINASSYSGVFTTSYSGSSVTVTDVSAASSSPFLDNLVLAGAVTGGITATDFSGTLTLRPGITTNVSGTSTIVDVVGAWVQAGESIAFTGGPNTIRILDNQSIDLSGVAISGTGINVNFIAGSNSATIAGSLLPNAYSVSAPSSAPVTVAITGTVPGTLGGNFFQGGVTANFLQSGATVTLSDLTGGGTLVGSGANTTFILPGAQLFGATSSIVGGTGTRLKLTGAVSGINLAAIGGASGLSILDIANTNTGIAVGEVTGANATPTYILSNGAGLSISSRKSGVLIFGGTGNDTLTGVASNQTLIGGYGGSNIRLNAWADNQTVFAADPSLGSSPVGRAAINLTGHNDLLVGRSGSPTGIDIVNLTGAGGDTVFASAGDMNIRNAADRGSLVVGGSGALSTRGSASGGDTVFGGSTSDMVFFGHTRDPNGSGNVFVGTTGSDLIDTSAYVASTIFCGSGQTTIRIEKARSSVVDVIVGFKVGTDTLDLSSFGSASAVAALLANASQTVYANAIDLILPTGQSVRFVGMTSLPATGIVGGNVRQFAGTSGADVFTGVAGSYVENDFLFQSSDLGSGDNLTGGSPSFGNNLFITDSGPVTLTGTQLSTLHNLDLVDIGTTLAGSQVTFTNSVASQLTNTTFRFRADATISASATAAPINIQAAPGAGRAVTLTLSSSTSNFVQADGGYGRPTPGTSLTLIGGNAGDTISGSRNAVSIVGGSGNDVIRSSGANDTIEGGGGSDTLGAGGGSDLFIFRQLSESYASNANGADWIQGFKPGRDRIALAASLGSSLGLGALSGGTSIALNTVVLNSINSYSDFTNTSTGAAGTSALISGNFTASTTALLQVSQVIVNNGNLRGAYLFINDASAGYQSAADLVINISGSFGGATATDFTFV